MFKISIYLLLLIITASLALPQQATYDYDYKSYDEDPDEVTESTISTTHTAPVFVQKSRTISVREGEPVEMQCDTVTPTKDVLIFRRNKNMIADMIVIFVGTIVIDPTTKFEQDSNNSTFRIKEVEKSDAAIYSCVYQKQTKLSYELNVLYAPSAKAKSHTEQRVPKGSSVSLECEVNGNPPPTVKWSKEGGRMLSGKKSEEGYEMMLQDVDRHVEGSYMCTAENEIGKAVSAPMKILVEYVPEITTEKAIIRTGQKEKVELVCIVHARPAADVYWFKDANLISPNSHVAETESGHRHVITIDDVTENDFGSYMCQANNDKGESNATINLTDLPRRPNFTSSATSADETSYTLVWNTESFYLITEYMLKYRLARANDSTDLPGQWVENSTDLFDAPKDTIQTDGLIHELRQTIDDLAPATNYQAAVSVKNINDIWGEEGTFNFSTRKEMTSPQSVGAAVSLAALHAGFSVAFACIASLLS